MNKISIFIISAIGIVLLLGTLYLFDKRNIQKVGILLEGTVSDEPWDRQGYEGLLSIGEEFDADIYIKENVQTETEIVDAIENLTNEDVPIIFGHSQAYGRYFSDVASSYPNTHFVYFNGSYTADNVTSLNFDAHAMGFFGGMVAGEMTETGDVGVIAAYEWQPEVEGFYEGVKFQRSNANVHVNFINDWNASEDAIEIYEEMKDEDVDVFYPTGDLFGNAIVEQVDQDGLYVVGYVSDDIAVDERRILTTTIQHVDQLYMLAADLYQKNKLKGGTMTFDFADDAISLGSFSSDVPEEFKQYLLQLIEAYKKTGLLPNEQYKD